VVLLATGEPVPANNGRAAGRLTEADGTCPTLQRAREGNEKAGARPAFSSPGNDCYFLSAEVEAEVSAALLLFFEEDFFAFFGFELFVAFGASADGVLVVSAA
jgi:hypothetical protein